ncbi:MAG: hypothetical protein QOI24_1029 [Acidobacteriota bacterium]|jgi:hypothetical protein|nr:hypothetical protein [Acidobacteriota bacterium]
MKRIAMLVVLMIVACSKTEAPAPKVAAPAKPALAAPTTDAARELVTTSGEFSQYEFTNAAYTLPLRKSAMNEPQLTAAKQLAAAKWLLFRGDYVVLTEKALSDKRFLSRPNDTVDIVPLARKEVTGVTAVRPLPDGNVAVDFDWKWIPNEVGVAFKTGMLHERYAALGHATATLINDGGTWSVSRVEPPSS